MTASITAEAVPTGNGNKISITIQKNRINLLKGPIGSGKTLICKYITEESRQKIAEATGQCTASSFESVNRITLPPVFFVQNRDKRSPLELIHTKLNRAICSIFASYSDVTCPSCETEIRRSTISSIAEAILRETGKYLICAQYNGKISGLINRGFYFYIVNGEKKRIDSSCNNQPIDILVDKVNTDRSSRNEIIDSLKRTSDIDRSKIVVYKDSRKDTYSTGTGCPSCDHKLLPPSPALFDKKRASCTYCRGSGKINTTDSESILERTGTNVLEMLKPFKYPVLRHHIELFFSTAPFEPNEKFKRLSRKREETLINHVSNFLNKKYSEGSISRKFYSKFFTDSECPHCKGTGVNQQRTLYKTAGLTSDDVYEMNFNQLLSSAIQKYLHKLDPELVKYIENIIEAGMGSCQWSAINSEANAINATLAGLTALPALPISNSLIISEMPAHLTQTQLKHTKNIISILTKSNNTVLLTATDNSFDRLADNIIVLKSEVPVSLSTGNNTQTDIEYFKLEMNRNSSFLKGKSILIPTASYNKYKSEIQDFFKSYTKTDNTLSHIVNNSSQNISDFFNISDEIADRYSSQNEAEIAGFTPSFFKLSSPRGKCPACYPSHNTAKCNVCNGAVFNEAVLKIHYNGYNIGQMMKSEFRSIRTENLKKTTSVAELLISAGCGNITPGSYLSTLSAGELQIINLVKQIHLKMSGKYLFEENTLPSAYQDDKIRLFNIASRVASASGSFLIISDSAPSGCNTDIILTL